MDFFGSYRGTFWGESSVVALYSNLFEELGKNEMKNWNLHSNLLNPKK
jgi:hypothetical protein